MTRLVGGLALVLVGLVMLVFIAPVLLVVALITLFVAWRWPRRVQPLIAADRLQPVPASLRSTPMRFTGALVALTFALTVVNVAITGTPSDRAASASRPSVDSAVSQRTARPTVSPSPRPTHRPTPRPKSSATASATPSPAPTPVLGAEPTGVTQVGRVVKIVDGDTIDVDVDGVVMRVRYIGVDTPEVHNGVEWLGAEASAANAGLVSGQEVVLEKDVSETDRYGRALRYVWLHEAGTWLLVNLELVRQGYAQVATYPPDVKYVDLLFLPAQQVAREAALGLWAATPAPAPTAPPAQTSNCEPSYPDFCIPVDSADLDCGDIAWRRFTVLWNVPNPDPHRFDGDGDGIGCES